jgi:hypothetical protein
LTLSLIDKTIVSRIKAVSHSASLVQGLDLVGSHGQLQATGSEQYTDQYHEGPPLASRKLISLIEMPA